MQIGSDHEAQLEADNALANKTHRILAKHGAQLKITNAVNKLRLAGSEIRTNWPNTVRVEELINSAKEVLEEVMK